MATDGEHQLVEAIEFENGRGFTFQWHPEDYRDAHSRALLKTLFIQGEINLFSSLPVNQVTNCNALFRIINQ